MIIVWCEYYKKGVALHEKGFLVMLGLMMATTKILEAAKFGVWSTLAMGEGGLCEQRYFDTIIGLLRYKLEKKTPLNNLLNNNTIYVNTYLQSHKEIRNNI